MNPIRTPRIIFIDFKSAFDSVQWDKLFEIIKKQRILNEEESQLLKFIYTNVSISNGKGVHVRIGKGTPQGMSTSPILFQIYIDSILRTLNQKGLETYLFADDMAIITNNEHQARSAIETTEKLAGELGLKINKQKSGILPISKSRSIFSLFTDKKLLNFPYVNQYKYLGTIINTRVDISGHLAAAKPKMNLIINKLTIIRKVGNLKLNSNLFELYIKPQFRLVAPLIELCTATEKKEIILLYKSLWKRMTCLPMSTPNEILKLLIGDPIRDMDSMVKITKYKLKKYQEGMPVDFVYMEGLRRKKRWKRIPAKLTKLIGIMYSQRDENGRLLNRENLLNQHKINVDIIDMLDIYQLKQNTTYIRLRIKMLVSDISKIAR